ncbi:MAG: hypothetical protein FJ317_01605 [SAR202 cluster bacterium]|nr:hypothetical protein [SAR202 cluster bacterium]
MRNTVTRPTYETWFRDIHLVSVNDGVAVIACPSAFVADMLESRLANIIYQALEAEGIETEAVFATYEQVEAAVAGARRGDAEASVGAERVQA